MFTEVASYVNESQFEPGESAYECGFFAVALNKYAAKYGEKPSGTGEQVDVLADDWYQHCDGANVPANKNGMTLWQLYYVLHLAGLHYQGLVPFDAERVKDWVRAWIRLGYPVILAVGEASIYDIELGDKVPYSWKPTGNHIITVSGLEGENFLVRDPASIAPSGVRPGPRVYDASKLQIVSATAVVLPWLSRPAPGFNPLSDVHPTQAKPVATYTIKTGDTLSSIASEHEVSFASLLSKNKAALDAEAAKHGYSNSADGKWIFPETEITL